MQLVLINISDHSTRVHANNPVEGERTRVLGCLLGQQSGRVVDISNSLEIKHETGEHGITIDEAYLAKKQEQCTLHVSVVAHLLHPPFHCMEANEACMLGLADKQTFSDLDIVGWYSTGSEVKASDMEIHRLVRTANLSFWCCQDDGQDFAKEPIRQSAKSEVWVLARS